MTSFATAGQVLQSADETETVQIVAPNHSLSIARSRDPDYPADGGCFLVLHSIWTDVRFQCRRVGAAGVISVGTERNAKPRYTINRASICRKFNPTQWSVQLSHLSTSWIL